MTEQQAMDIINKARISNSFTMGQTTEEFIQNLRKRYLQIYNIVLPADHIEIAKVILELNEE